MDRRVYLAASLRPEYEALRNDLVDALLEHNIQVITDAGSPRHRPKDAPKLKGSYPQRVDRLLAGCSGIVVFLPSGGEHGGATSGPMNYEILLATKHRLPMLVFKDTRLTVAWTNEDDGVVTAVFGAGSDLRSAAITLDQVDTREAENRIFNASRLQFAVRAYSAGPISLPEQLDDHHRRIVRAEIDTFVTRLSDPHVNPYAFYIGPFRDERTRRIVAAIAEEVTGLPCLTGSDQRYGSKRVEESITAASFVVTNLTRVRPACVYELGLARGSDRDILVLHRGNPRLPYGPDKLDRTQVKSLQELAREVRRYADLHAPWILNRHRRRTVVLVHGIRTRANWQEMVKDVLERDGTNVVPVKYGYLDLFRFWFPFLTRNQPVRFLEKELATASKRADGGALVVIAHSFGTYALTKVLARRPDIRPERIILSASIVRNGFRWDDIVRTSQIINDCSRKDPWPVLANIASWGYGPTGTFGFGGQDIEDRFHDVQHGAYLERSFIEEYWRPFVEDGHVVRGPVPDGGHQTSWWISALGSRWILVGLVVVFAAGWLLRSFGAS
jgi:hypothetical protein